MKISINPTLILIFISFFFLSLESNAEENTSLSYNQIQETYKAAQDFFSFGEYDLAFGAYEIISIQAKTSKKTRALCLKKMGIINIQRGEYSKSRDFLLSAKKELPDDSEVLKALQHLSSVKALDNRDGQGIYIIQVGAFKSSNNANNIIKNIRASNDNFSLKKHKKGGLFIVYFDNFNSKKDADNFAIKLKSLNESLNFHVKQKDILDNG